MTSTSGSNPVSRNAIATATENNPCPPGDTAVGQTVYYLFKNDPTNPNEEKRIPEMTGAELKSSGTQADFDPQTGQPIVRLHPETSEVVL